jgi:hypothetical protein
MNRRSRAALLLAALPPAVFLASCAGHTAATQGMQSISSLEPVETWLQDRGPEGNAIVFRNNTRQQIRISTIQLLQCENTSPACATLHPNVVLDPGQTRDGMIVRPFDRQQGYRFTYQYHYEYVAAAPGAAAPPGPPGTTRVTSRSIVDTVLVRGNALRPEEARALGARFHGIRLRADSVVMQVGQTFGLTSLEVLAVDSAGHSLGVIPFFDAGLTSGAIVMSAPMRIMAVMPGVSQVTVRVSRAFWPDSTRPRPEAFLRVVVH